MPLFRGILSEKSIYGIISLIQGHLHGRKVISKVKNKMVAKYFNVKYDCSTSEDRNKCITSSSSSRANSHFQGQIISIPFIINKARNMCNASFSWDFVGKIPVWHSFVHTRSSLKVERSFPRSKM